MKGTLIRTTENNISSEKRKPFQLVKYFTIISLFVLFVGTLIMSILNIHWARAMQIKQREHYAHALVENLNHQVFTQFVIPVALKYGKIELSHPEQFNRMDTVVRHTLHSFQVEMVNIYDVNDTISYSLDSALLGRRNTGGAGFQQALTGQYFFKLTSRSPSSGIPFSFHRQSRLVTFAPLRAERELLRLSGPVLGVVEIVQDLSEDYQAIWRYQSLVILTSGVVMGVLLVVLVFVVKRGEAIMQRQAQEQVHLKERLARAEHLSALGGMLASVSHEIRNPLGIIRSSAELLKKKMAQLDPANDFPSIIVEESSRLNNIITDFLKYARPIEPNLQPCHLNDIVQKNLHYLEPQIQGQGYIVDTHLATELPDILGDAEMLYQAILNLLINALQSMPGGGRLQIQTIVEKQTVSLCITDEGEGITPEVAEKIWDPFFTTKEKGTGLGLGIVRNIIKAHNGQITIGNRSTKGVRVTVALPATPNRQPVAETERHSHGNHSDC